MSQSPKLRDGKGGGNYKGFIVCCITISIIVVTSTALE